ncbi:TRAP transporter small permease subunit [Mesobacterium pallidum]|uniref:TRAP transporter small permease subunit n=1 Tax=Mesobacterium pallidum TaxID=2872037 RepID=UPI001EE23A7A|nr:TRAP transporter small permease subunit [Mesobacterium pallidum]
MHLFLSWSYRLLCWPGRIASWLILPLILSVVLSVVAAQFGLSTLYDWEGRVPILGGGLTVNTLVDLQWYIFALIVLFGGIWAHLDHRHVTVDFIAGTMSRRWRGWVTVLGNTFLLLPLCWLVVRYGSNFAAVAWRTGEGSNQGGLAAHWLIKGALPVSFALLGAAGIVQSIRTLRGLSRRDGPEFEESLDG